MQQAYLVLHAGVGMLAAGLVLHAGVGMHAAGRFNMASCWGGHAYSRQIWGVCMLDMLLGLASSRGQEMQGGLCASLFLLQW